MVRCRLVTQAPLGTPRHRSTKICKDPFPTYAAKSRVRSHHGIPFESERRLRGVVAAGRKATLRHWGSRAWRSFTTAMASGEGEPIGRYGAEARSRTKPTARPLCAAVCTVASLRLLCDISCHRSSRRGYQRAEWACAACGAHAHFRRMGCISSSPRGGVEHRATLTPEHFCPSYGIYLCHPSRFLSTPNSEVVRPALDNQVRRASHATACGSGRQSELLAHIRSTRQRAPWW